MYEDYGSTEEIYAVMKEEQSHVDRTINTMAVSSEPHMRASMAALARCYPHVIK